MGDGTGVPSFLTGFIKWSPTDCACENRIQGWMEEIDFGGVIFNGSVLVFAWACQVYLFRFACGGGGGSTQRGSFTHFGCRRNDYPNPGRNPPNTYLLTE